MNNSKNITFPWRKEIPRKLGHRDLTGVQKIVLVLKGKDQYGYDDVEYIVELLNEPTQYNLKGEKIKNMRWWCHTISDDHAFRREYGDEKTLKKINQKIFDESFRVKEVIK